MDIYVNTIKYHYYTPTDMVVEEDTFTFNYSNGVLTEIGTCWNRKCKNMQEVFEVITKKFHNTSYQIKDIQRGYN